VAARTDTDMRTENIVSSMPCGDVERSVHIFACPFVWATRDTSLRLCIRKRLVLNIVSIIKIEVPSVPVISFYGKREKYVMIWLSCVLGGYTC
jgi:hypothetical protein